MKSKLTHFLALGGLLAVAGVTVGCNSYKYTVITKNYRIVVDTEEDISYAHQLNEKIEVMSKFKLPIVSGSEATNPYEIIIDSHRKEVQELTDDLAEEGYGIKESNGKIIIGYKTNLARMCAIDHLLGEFSSINSLRVPTNTYVRGTCKFEDKLTFLDLIDEETYETPNIGAPFIIKEEGQARDAYYMYGIDNDTYDWCIYQTSNSIDNVWTKWGGEIISPDFGDKDIDREWGPVTVKVYRYKGSYYMFTDYRSVYGEGNCYGVSIFKSDSPVGPFMPCSSNDDNKNETLEKRGIYNYHITSDKKLGYTWDGSLYVDPTGQPWLVYMDLDNNDSGLKYSATRLSSDLSHIIDEKPIDLFWIDSAPWVDEYFYADGCSIYTLKSGQLFMTWSAVDKNYDYVTGYATADSITGKWTQHDRLMFTGQMISPNCYDGGYSMFYKDGDQLNMVQNVYISGINIPVVVPVKETPSGTNLLLDLYTKK